MKSKQFLLLLTIVNVMTLLVAAQPVNPNGPPNLETNTVTLPPGWSLVANPLFHLRGTTLAEALPDNTVGELFQQMPHGTMLLKFNNATQRFSRKNVFRQGHWSNPHETFNPGEGALLFNPTHKPLSVAFTGNSWFGAVLIPAGLSLISSPGPGTIDFAPRTQAQTPPGPFAYVGISFGPQEGDVVYTFDSATGGFQSHTFHNGTWDVLPVMEVGEACFVHTTQSRIIQYTGPRPE